MKDQTKAAKWLNQLRGNGGPLDKLAVNLNRVAMEGRGALYRKASSKIDDAIRLLGEAADTIEQAYGLETGVVVSSSIEVSGDEETGDIRADISLQMRAPSLLERLSRRVEDVERQPDHVRHRTVQFEFTHDDEEDAVYTQAPELEQLAKEELVALFLTLSLLIEEKFGVTLEEVSELVYLAGAQLPPKLTLIKTPEQDEEE